MISAQSDIIISVIMGSISNGHDLLVLDGTAESNSGQTFRMAMALSAITLQPIKIENIWGTKQPANKRGMKALQ